MKSRTIALIATFAAIAIVLNTIRIPTFYWPNMSYSLAEIPVVVALLIFGFKIGFLVEVLHVVGQEIFFPAGPPGLVVYPMGFVANLLMLIAIYLTGKFIANKTSSGNTFGDKKRTIYLTGSAAALRGAFMPVIDALVLYGILLPLVLGRGISGIYIAALVPSFIIYNVTTALYAVPFAIFLGKRVSNYLRIEPRLPI